MEFVKQYGLGHKVQRLYIHWDITTKCEYKCSYCYARKEYKDKWNFPGIWSKQQNVINELSKSTLPIFLGLLGGEPTSNHKYFEILNQLYPIIKSNLESRLYITTNGFKSNDIYDKHPIADSNQFYFLFSLHPEYVNFENYEHFRSNIELLHNKGYRIKVNLMLHPSKQYWEFLQYAYNDLRKYFQFHIEIHPHYIYSDAHNAVKYSEDFYEYFREMMLLKKEEFVFETDKNIYHYNDHNIFENKFNQFKDWNCWNNNYEINIDCEVNQFCFDSKIPIPVDYFKNISEIKSTKCPHKFCSCDGLLKIKKEKYE